MKPHQAGPRGGKIRETDEVRTDGLDDIGLDPVRTDGTPQC